MKDFQIELLEEFDDHQLVAYIHDSEVGLRGFIAIHRVSANHAFGATRFWHFDQAVDALEDALRLSRLMSYKAALAGLPYGGAKCVLIAPTDTSTIDKTELLKKYAQRVNYLHGNFITGSDVGITDDDVKILANESPYIVGAVSDPVKYTVLGVYYGIQACLKEKFGTESLEGRTVSIQGLGKIGWHLLEKVYSEAKQVYVYDIDKQKMDQAQQQFPNINVVNEEESLYPLPVDVFSPCALGGILNSGSIDQLQCKIVSGSANNQLQNDDAGKRLYERGILYAPDYVINAGGLMAVVDEYENHGTDDQRVTQKVKTISTTLAQIFARSKQEDKPTSDVADEMAENVFNTVQ